MQKEYVKKAFTKDEIDILYYACLSYGDELSEANKKIRNVPEAREIIEANAKKAYNMAREIAESTIM